MTRSARLRTILLMTLPALGIALVSVVAILLIPDVPSTLAAHWGFDGKVDRVDGIGSFVTIVAVLVPVLVGGVVAFTVPSLRHGTSRFFLRVVIALTTWIGFLLSVAMVGAVFTQRNVTDPWAVPLSTAFVPLGVAFLVASIAAWLFSRLAPVVEEQTGPEGTAVALDLAPGEIAYWTGTVKSPPGIIALPTVVGCGLAVLFIALGLPIWTVAFLVPFYHAMTSILVWRVVVDRHGLIATGLFGYPRIRVPIAEVVGASAVEVEPMREFGGWGVRVGRTGRWGIVIRKGSAIEVERTSGAPFVVTVDDAATGAALLTSLARRLVS